MVNFGKVAYEAYCCKTGWKSLVSGAQLPSWDELKQEIRDAWEAAAMAVKNFGVAMTGQSRSPVCENDCGDGSTVYDDRPRPGA